MPHEPPAPLFILGAARSGTTMLRLILNRHSQLSIPPESHFLIPLIERLPLRGALSQAQTAEACELIATCDRFPSWAMSRPQLERIVRQLEGPSLAELIDAVFRHQIGAAGADPACRWGDKTPEYSPYARQLHRLFPSARFIHIVRDGRDVSNSLRSKGWHGWTEHQRGSYWSRIVGGLQKMEHEIGGQFLRVTYEELVLDMEPQVARICEFLGVSPEPQMCQFHEDASRHVADYERRAQLHTKLSRPPRSEDCHRWRRESSWLRVLLFEATAGRVMQATGQPLAFGGVWTPLRLATQLAYRPLGAAASLLYRLYHGFPRGAKNRLRQQPVFRALRTQLRR